MVLSSWLGLPSYLLWIAMPVAQSTGMKSEMRSHKPICQELNNGCDSGGFEDSSNPHSMMIDIEEALRTIIVTAETCVAGDESVYRALGQTHSFELQTVLIMDGDFL